ncbi:MAG: PQQ-binding-like beta-propeller repeat protein [Candidatus Hodarchaeota archaeon]
MTKRQKAFLFGLIHFVILLLVLISGISSANKTSLAVSSQDESTGFIRNWNWGNYDKPVSSIDSVVPLKFNSDGIDDVLIGSFDSNAYIINGASGETLLAFSTPRFGVEAVAEGSFARNNSVDLLIGGTDHKAYLVDGFSRELLWQTPDEYPSGPVSAVTGADFDNDGQDEAIIASEDLWVYAFRGDSGNLMWISEEQLQGKPVNLNTGDLDLDEIPDIIVGTDRGVYAFSGINGSALWYDESGLSVTDLVVYPRESKAPFEIIYATIEGYVVGINATNGEMFWKTAISKEAIWDLAYGSNEYNRGIRLFVGSADGSMYILSAQGGGIYWSYETQEDEVVGVGEVERETSYWYTRYNASLVATRSGQVSCVYKDYWGHLMHQWDPYYAPARIDRIQAAHLNHDDITDFFLFLEDSSIMTLSGATGKPLWASARPKGPITAIAIEENTRIIAGSQDGGIYSVWPASGNEFLLFSHSEAGIASVIFRDIDQNEDQEILAGADDGLVILLDGPNGTQVWNNTVSGPVAVLGTISTRNDDFLNVVVGSRDGMLSILDGETGSIEWLADDPEKDIVSLGISDFDGDGDNEIVVGSDDSKLYCYDHDGNLLWVYGDLTNSINRVVVGDLDGDGIADVGVGSYYNVSGVKGSTGEELWRNPNPPGYVRAISQNDITHDGIGDVIVGTYESIHALDGITGEVIWTQKAEQDVISMDSNDINKDGTPDVIAGTSTGAIYLLDGISGQLIWQDEAFHAVEALEIMDGNDDAAELIIADGSGIRSFYIARTFSGGSNTTNTTSNNTATSSIKSGTPPLISDSSSSFGWTIGIAITSLIALAYTRKRFKKKEM